jgi:AcrR family transcriptional regulator
MPKQSRTKPASKPSFSALPTDADGGSRALMERTVDRTVAGRYAAAAEEVDKLVEATYRVIERAGSVNPKIREILTEAGVSTQVFYRHFQSKDELMLVLLDDGRRRLATYLEHQMDKAGDPLAQVRAWVEGTLAQARDPKAAARTRPFSRSLGHLQEQYPDEHRESVEVLVGLLRRAIERAVEDGTATSTSPAQDATLIYLMTHGLMDRHLRELTAPSKAEVDRAAAFALRGIGATGATGI